MKLGISGQALGEVMSFADIVKLGKKYGVTEYEIWPCNAGADWDYREGSLDDVKKDGAGRGRAYLLRDLGRRLFPQKPRLTPAGTRNTFFTQWTRRRSWARLW